MPKGVTGQSFRLACRIVKSDNESIRLITLRGIVVDVVKDIPIHQGEFNSTPSPHFLGSLQCLGKIIVGKTCGTTPGKGWNKVAGKSATEDICAYTNHRSGIKHGVDTALGVVAHN